jgi:hypothetical protein
MQPVPVVCAIGLKPPTTNAKLWKYALKQLEPFGTPLDTMSFPTEPIGYEKTILSDLQGSWEVLRSSVANCPGFEGCDRALFHIDEAMSWETVRHLDRMPKLLLIIRNLCLAGGAPEEVIENLEDVEDVLTSVQDAIYRGEKL